MPRINVGDRVRHLGCGATGVVVSNTMWDADWDVFTVEYDEPHQTGKSTFVTHKSDLIDNWELIPNIEE